MEPLIIILVPGLFGGLVLALLIADNRQGTPSTVVPRRLAAPSPALINMAHIQIEGVGGLGWLPPLWLLRFRIRASALRRSWPRCLELDLRLS
jgi:hypothetical protein